MCNYLGAGCRTERLVTNSFIDIPSSVFSQSPRCFLFQSSWQWRHQKPHVLYFVLQAFYRLECHGTSTIVFLLHWLRFLLSPTVCVKLMNLVVLNEIFIVFCPIFNHAHHLIKTRVGYKMCWQCLAIRWLPPVLSNSAFGFPVIRHVLTPSISQHQVGFRLAPCNGSEVSQWLANWLPLSLEFGDGERKEKVTSTQKVKEAFVCKPPVWARVPLSRIHFQECCGYLVWALGYGEGDKQMEWRGIGYLHSRRSSFGCSLTFTYVVTHSCISWVYLKHEKKDDSSDL